MVLQELHPGVAHQRLHVLAVAMGKAPEPFYDPLTFAVVASRSISAGEACTTAARTFGNRSPIVALTSAIPGP